jgi:hypothetical protein
MVEFLFRGTEINADKTEKPSFRFHPTTTADGVCRFWVPTNKVPETEHHTTASNLGEEVEVKPSLTTTMITPLFLIPLRQNS